MTFLPIVERELRVAARRRMTYWMRAFVVLAVVLVSAWIFALMTGARGSEIGQVLFYVLTGGAGLFCLFAGVRSTADTLSEEKRDGTLGLLFLTNLRGYDIVLGKLAANSLGTIYGVLSIVPALGIPILLGGTSLGQFVRVSACLLVTLFFSLAAGMLASAICRSSRWAMSWTFILILILTAGMPALGAWLAYLAPNGNVVSPFLLPSPVFGYVAALDLNLLKLQDQYYWSLGIIVVATIVCLGTAALLVPSSWQDRPRENRLRDSGTEGSTGVARHEFRTRLLNRNPFFWLATRPRSRVFHAWWGFAFVAVIWLWGMAKFDQEWFNVGTYFATGFFLNSMLKVWLASEACRSIAAERKQGTLELLLATPLSVNQIITGQRLALERQFAAPIITAMIVETLMLLAAFQEGGWSDSERTFMGGWWFLSIGLLMLDVFAFFWTGLWAGLTAASARRAYSRIISQIVVLPMVIYAVFLAGAAVGAFGRGPGPGIFLAVWFLCGLIVDLAFGLEARRRLLGEFRQRAMERFQSPGR